MTKKIQITGKRNVESLKGIKNPKRTESEKWDNKELLLNNKKQTNILNQLYLNEKFDGCVNVEKSIKKKIKGYEKRNESIFQKVFISFFSIFIFSSIKKHDKIKKTNHCQRIKLF